MKMNDVTKLMLQMTAWVLLAPWILTAIVFYVAFAFSTVLETVRDLNV